MKITPMQVTLLDHMGSDLSVVNAARVSFAKESHWIAPSSDQTEHGVEYLSDADTKLINYLAKHNHWTPFGHCFAQFRIKAPIFVARQLVKHQVGLVWNEESRRYIDSEPEFWFPEVWRGRPEGSIKQGSGNQVMNEVGCFFDQYEHTVEGVAALACEAAWDAYTSMISSGVAPEQARMVLPLNTHTEWYWSGSLAAWARVCKLRLDPHAQAETREVAQQIDSHMGTLFPVSWKELV